MDLFKHSLFINLDDRVDRFQHALNEFEKINIQVISTSEIKISVLIGKQLIRKAVNALHKEFNL